ncbi:lipopolysaccharide biosynthesis protein [Microbacterium sp. HMWF026]|uniref:lipopolysaccharide biosynthesis protein n=1 Tax=Microbacterium sp. HMWF026 TaxID=2056861 RepID=UPI0015E8078C|nr:polysaccharide biosynthesis C-terminal domain-containing protein [Microbacterium sp. HMWF026]
MFQASRLGDLALGFAWQILAARLLPVSEFGLVAVVTSAASFVVIGLSVGGDEVMTSARSGLLRQTFVREAKIRGVICIAAVCLAALVLVWSALGSLTIIYSVGTAAVYLCNAYFTRQFNAVLSIIGVGAQALAMGAFFFFLPPDSAVELLSGLCFSVILRALVMSVCAVGLGKRDDGAGYLRPTVAKRFSLMASSASTPLLGRQLHVMIAAGVGIALGDIGAYSAAYALAYMAATATILGIGATTMPRLADAASRGHHHVSPEWRRVLIATSGLSIPAVVLSMAVAPSLMLLLYGPEYGDLGGELYIGISAALLIQRLTGGGATNALLVATDRTSMLLGSIVASAAALVLTDLIFMPLIGIWGAILGSVAAAVTGAAMTLYVVHRSHAITLPVSPQLKVLMISAGFALPLYVVTSVARPAPWVVVCAAGLVGMLVLWVVQRHIFRPNLEGES